MRPIGYLALVLLSLNGVLFAAPVEAPAISAAAKAQIDAGKQVFAATCTNCHGAAGNGALGPALVNRKLSLELVRNTILNGRIGSAMPKFKGELDATSLAAVIAYVTWLETDGSEPQAPISLQEAIEGPLAPSSQPIAVGQDQGVAARGAEIFFDPTRICSCRTCHSSKERGGPVGPDLATFKESADEAYRRVIRPPASAASFRAISITLRNGQQLRGVLGRESEEEISFFDVSSCPPVKRTFSRSEILKLSEISQSGIYDHRTLKYSKQELLDVSAYLGTTNSSR